jgi:hypothetical protein
MTVQWGDVATWVAAVGTVAAFFVTWRTLRAQKEALADQRREIAGERDARLKAVRDERRRIMNGAVDEIDEGLALTPDVLAGLAVRIPDEYLRDACRLLREHAVHEILEPVVEARNQVSRYNASAELARALATPAQLSATETAATPEFVGKLRDVLSDARVQLENMRAALDVPQATGAQWLD